MSSRSSCSWRSFLFLVSVSHETHSPQPIRTHISHFCCRSTQWWREEFMQKREDDLAVDGFMDPHASQASVKRNYILANSARVSGMAGFLASLTGKPASTRSHRLQSVPQRPVLQWGQEAKGHVRSSVASLGAVRIGRHNI
jgi:hypothetical protein